ncbi:MAG: hypothetical protein H6815_05430 [Phycisphaeraceae bacterium]|nr:hypothetical protein [Phycisphaerales bacterium]MCB9859879.1 hypothetical protein [Phycisphaeraceae bacterium]
MRSPIGFVSFAALTALLTFDSSAQISITSDNRLIVASAENLGVALDDEFKETGLVYPGQPWNESVDASVAGVQAKAMQQSELTSFKITGSGRTEEDAFCGGGCTMYSNAESRIFAEFTVATSTPFSIIGELHALHVNEGVAQSEISLSGSVTGELYTNLAEASKTSVTEQIMFSGTFEPEETYYLSVGCVSHTTETESLGSGTATFEFIIDAGDTDGDGLADGWETNGIDVNGDGTIDLDLPAMGADPMRKDLFIEVDAMTGRAPHISVLPAVIVAFANSPVENPNGTTGITLHPVLDEINLPLRDYPNKFTEFDQDKNAYFGTMTERASANWTNIKAARNLAFRYCIFANTWGGTTSSGLAELPGDDFMVTLGGWNTPGGTPNQQAGTFMHELGHTLFLRHGGDDSIHNKPNYVSVMNYLWQTPAFWSNAFWILDYSRIELPSLNEAMLIEADGLGAPMGAYPVGAYVMFGLPGTPHPNGLRQFQYASLDHGDPVDWNNTGTISMSATSGDINYLYTCTPPPANCYQQPSPNEILNGHDDWSVLWYHIGGHANFSDGVHTSTTDDGEITSEIFEALNSIPPLPSACYADCDKSGSLNIFDYICFGNAYSANDPYADCDGSGSLNVFDYICFGNEYASGCP